MIVWVRAGETRQRKTQTQRQGNGSEIKKKKKKLLCSCRCAQLHFWTDLVVVLIRERNEDGETVKLEGKGSEKDVCDAWYITAVIDQGFGIMIKVLLSLLENKETCTHSCTRICLHRLAHLHHCRCTNIQAFTHIHTRKRTYPSHHSYSVSYYPSQANSLVHW